MPSVQKKGASRAGESQKASAGKRKVLQSGKYQLKNMKFLGDFMTTMGLTTTKIAEKAGLTQVTVYYWLKNDDAHLSSVENLLKAWGYRPVFKLVSPDENPSMTEIDIDVPGARRLAFLESGMQGFDRAELQKKMGVGTTTIYYWLSHDDILISHIFDVARATGQKVKISIRPL